MDIVARSVLSLFAPERTGRGPVQSRARPSAAAAAQRGISGLSSGSFQRAEKKIYRKGTVR